MRLVTLLLFIIACGPVAGADPTPTPGTYFDREGNIVTPPWAAIVTPLAVQVPVAEAQPTAGSCITTLQQYYTPEQWESLSVVTGPASLIHLGEQACKEQVEFQTLPVQVQLLMLRMQTLRDLGTLKRDSAYKYHEHTCYDNYGSISCR